MQKNVEIESKVLEMDQMHQSPLNGKRCTKSFTLIAHSRSIIWVMTFLKMISMLWINEPLNSIELLKKVCHGGFLMENKVRQKYEFSFQEVNEYIFCLNAFSCLPQWQAELNKVVSENDQGEDSGVKTDGKKSNDDKQKHHSVLLQVKKLPAKMSYLPSFSFYYFIFYAMTHSIFWLKFSDRLVGL